MIAIMAINDDETTEIIHFLLFFLRILIPFVSMYAMLANDNFKEIKFGAHCVFLSFSFLHFQLRSFRFPIIGKLIEERRQIITAGKNDQDRT